MFVMDASNSKQDKLTADVLDTSSSVDFNKKATGLSFVNVIGRSKCGA